MTWRWNLMLTAALILGWLTGCGDNGGGADDDSAQESDVADSNGSTLTQGSESENGTSDTSNGTDSEEVCLALDMNVEQLPVRVMLLQDRSTSMNDVIGDASKWKWAEEAVRGMVTQFDAEIEFGIDFFPFGTARCDVPNAVISDTQPSNGGAIMNLMETHTTPPSSLGTPLYLALSNYTRPDYAPLFTGAANESYLVVISDGSDTCGVNGQTMNAQLEGELAAVTSQLLDQQLIRTFVIGFGDADVYGDTGGLNPRQLNAIAAAGGTPYTTYINAQNGESLQTALRDIAESVHISCAFEVGEYDPKQVNPDLINVYFDKGVDGNGQVTGAVGRDDGCAAGLGWTWMDEEKTTIRFCDEACERLQQQTVNEISIEMMCSEHQVVVV